MKVDRKKAVLLQGNPQPYTAKLIWQESWPLVWLGRVLLL